MSLDHANADINKRYETFVIRLWVDSDAGFEHGEIRHVASHTGLRFRELGPAMHFMEKFAEGEHQKRTAADSRDRRRVSD